MSLGAWIATALVLGFLVVIVLGVRWILKQVRRSAYEELVEQLEETAE